MNKILNNTIINSDHIGILTGFVCGLHCIATPLFFIYHVELINLNKEEIFSWQSLNYLFILISFLAIYRSAQNSSKSIIKILMFVSWIFLCLTLLNEQFEVFKIEELYTYLAITSLCGLHYYNLKYCRCDDPDCCVQQE